MNKDNLFWGVVFLMAAIYILMRSVGMAPDVSIVRIIIGLLCITGFIKAAIDLEFGGMLFSLAILFIVFRRYIGLESMSSWSILMAALFGTIGLNMLFGDHASAYRNRKRAERYGEQFERQQEQYEGQMGENTDTSGASQGFYDSNMQGEHIVLSGLFNGTKKNLQSANFKSALVDCTFCGMEVNMTGVNIPSGTAVITLDIHFAGVNFYIPADWNIVDQTGCTFGGVKEQQATAPTVGPTIIFEGKITFGGVEIYRV